MIPSASTKCRTSFQLQTNLGQNRDFKTQFRTSEQVAGVLVCDLDVLEGKSSPAGFSVSVRENPMMASSWGDRHLNNLEEVC